MFPKRPLGGEAAGKHKHAVVIADHAHANDRAHAPVDHAPLSTNPATAEGPVFLRQQVDASESLEAVSCTNPQSLEKTH